MAYYVGDANKVALKYESGTYATASGGAFWLGLTQSVDPDETMNVITTRYIGNATRDVGQFNDGTKAYTLGLTYFPQDFRMMYFALGSCTDAGSPIPYTHYAVGAENTGETHEVPDIRIPSFTAEVAQQDSISDGYNFVRTFAGCMVNSMTLTAAEGEPVSISLDCIAKDVTHSSGAAATVTADTSRPYMYSDVKVSIPSGTTLANVTNFELTINNNIDTPFFLDNNRVIGNPQPQNRDISASLTLRALSETTASYYTNFISGTEFNVFVDISQDTVGSEQCFITLSGCKMMDMTAPVSNEGMQEQTMSINAKTMFVSGADPILKWHGF